LFFNAPPIYDTDSDEEEHMGDCVIELLCEPHKEKTKNLLPYSIDTHPEYKGFYYVEIVDRHPWSFPSTTIDVRGCGDQEPIVKTVDNT
jgi:hypothetical protein